MVADFDKLEEQEDCFHPETGELLLGDIVCSITISIVHPVFSLLYK